MKNYHGQNGIMHFLLVTRQLINQNTQFRSSSNMVAGGSAVAAPIARDIMLFALQGKYPSLSAYPKDQRSEIKIRLNKLKGINNPHNENKTLKLDETQT